MQPNESSRSRYSQSHKGSQRHKTDEAGDTAQTDTRWPSQAAVRIEQLQNITRAAVVPEKRRKAELYDRARALNIHGRSYMSKGQLILVIRNRLRKIGNPPVHDASRSGRHGPKPNRASD